jgi:hypothetical protein
MASTRTTLTMAAIAANTFSGVAALARFRPILPGMRKARVPESWLPMIGTLKTAGGLGLTLGLAGVPGIGTAAAAGLTAFFAVAIGFHVRARDYSPQLGLAAGFLTLNTTVLAREIAENRRASGPRDLPSAA